MSTALYRRYRPENFAEVIGQEHVTEPLMQALRSNRVNHAYLFSGPRGCGKTTSARILARILNCARNTPETPSDTPCGECESCIELARGGPGSLDVVEIDAASHGGVDDARELRERATFSPSRDRFKIFILDEAHMVTAQGFNALLKIVEEPPEYLKFIFATTEPEKVIGTIRSRTHHYPFRLVAPETLQTYLASLAASEHIAVGAGVLPLVVRAGGGSVRDSLSVLDQLMAGAEGATLDYERAVSLLGFTHVTLLDDVVDALAARDGASMFRVVDHVIATGHEPRRFVEDVLERLRDLIVLSVSGDAAQAVLRSVPADQLARMRTQAVNLGASELSRSADVVNAALTEMSGATSPRLHLELLCARLLLPAADDTTAGIGARLDRLERGLASGAAARPVATTSAVIAPAPAPAAVAPVAAVAQEAPAPVSQPAPASPAAPIPASTGGAIAPPPWDDPAVVTAAPAEPEVSVPQEPAAVAPPAAADLAQAQAQAQAVPAAPQAAPAQPAPAQPAPGQLAPVQPATAPQAHVSSEASAVGASTTDMLRRRWPEVLDTLSRLRKATWALVAQNAQVADLNDSTLRLTFASAGLATAFRSGPGAELVQRAIRETLGFDVRVEGGIEEPGRAPAAPAAAALPSVRPPSSGSVAGIDPVAAAASWDMPATPAASRPAAAVPGVQPTTAAPVRAGRAVPDSTVPDSTVPDSAVPDPARAESREGGSPGSAPASPGHASEYGEEPPGDFDHEPAPEYGSGRTPAGTSRPAASGSARPSAAPSNAAPSNGAQPQPVAETAPPVAESPRRAAERVVAATRAQEEARAQIVDDPQPDDEDLASSGQVGAPLIAQILGGVVIEEILDV
ncbi:DNA polymerase-3 subunit gamma/tau [Sanguibacter gelidistatuariae]|uniref:DNA-directed DNA polymerase n=1 Tax=Sanguibacter gelidistatuariae TaxID=1814289 RepID=A0A1G6GN46_9MICO|nr:DNA polymerase III subunit gamma and tau [Sanguibacter gelidistatuariae]SDB83391.1 DNA polymerase-3 subunit gamma/tau [Sanguibacter gelidistatuariae]